MDLTNGNEQNEAAGSFYREEEQLTLISAVRLINVQRSVRTNRKGLADEQMMDTFGPSNDSSAKRSTSVALVMLLYRLVGTMIIIPSADMNIQIDREHLTTYPSGSCASGTPARDGDLCGVVVKDKYRAHSLYIRTVLRLFASGTNTVYPFSLQLCGLF